MMPVRTYDGRNGIFVDQRLAGEDVPVSGTVLITLCNGGLDRQGDLGIGDDRRKHDCVGMAAGLTEDPGDPEQKDGISLSKPAGITSVPDKAAEMATGTGKRGQINRINGIIVKNLRNGVAVFCLNGYHSSVWRKAMRMLWRQESNFGRGDSCFLFSCYNIL